MRVMMLAAGLATRLRPLSLVRPKVLAPVLGVPILDYWLERFREIHCQGLVINGFHLAEQLRAAVSERSCPFPLELVVEDRILGTGGGIRNALDRLGPDPVCVINGDILCDAPPDRLLDQHRNSNAAAGLLLHDCPPFNNVAVDPENRILGFGETARKLAALRPDLRLHAFTGIQVMRPDLLAPYPKGEFLDILTVYRHLIEQGRPPRALYWPDPYWREMGSLASYFELNRDLASAKPGTAAGLSCGRPVTIHPESSVAAGVECHGLVVLGRGTEVGAGARLDNVIAWDRVWVAPQSRITNCILADDARVSGQLTGTVVGKDGVWVPLSL